MEGIKVADSVNGDEERSGRFSVEESRSMRGGGESERRSGTFVNKLASSFSSAGVSPRSIRSPSGQLERLVSIDSSVSRCALGANVESIWGRLWDPGGRGRGLPPK